MGRSTTITHAVNGYSRYDVPESKAFSCTPGILYPVRIDFINARDRVSISQGIDVRSNPLAVPTFNPYTVRLHRFWVPMQLYHAEMRTNSSKFDMNNVSTNWIPNRVRLQPDTTESMGTLSGFSNSLLSWLRISHKDVSIGTYTGYSAVSLPASAKLGSWANADTYVAYWDIVRNYYSYSQWGLYSFVWPASWYVFASGATTYGFLYGSASTFFTQRYGNLEYLDAYFESQFYPNSVTSSNNTYNRSNLFYQIIASDLKSFGAVTGSGYPVSTSYVSINNLGPENQGPGGQFAASGSKTVSSLNIFTQAHPMAVVPSNPDRFSRLVPNGSSSDVSMAGITTIPQLAIASRMQEYKDLLGAGGSRYSDWLETFFASKIEHVDRPKLLFSASQTVNVQIVMNQAGVNNFGINGEPLGQQGGAIAFNSTLGRRQSYYFREPGYLIDMLSIRPVYYWAGVTPDYLNYRGADYFNPIYNDIGFQDVSAYMIVANQTAAVGDAVIAQEACFNEFRSSYDEVLGQLSSVAGAVTTSGNEAPLYSYWVQQRSLSLAFLGNLAKKASYYPALFVDVAQVNSPFASNVEDNFFINLSYSVQKKNLVNKTFATRLSNR